MREDSVENRRKTDLPASREPSVLSTGATILNRRRALCARAAARRDALRAARRAAISAIRRPNSAGSSRVCAPPAASLVTEQFRRRRSVCDHRAWHDVRSPSCSRRQGGGEECSVCGAAPIFSRYFPRSPRDSPPGTAEARGDARPGRAARGRCLTFAKRCNPKLSGQESGSSANPNITDEAATAEKRRPSNPLRASPSPDSCPLSFGLQR